MRIAIISPWPKKRKVALFHVNALHFLSDVVASGGILLGLILLEVTGWFQVDALIAFGS
jgi:divalent metal cation (Fe/Co/Zn/Cd) transporter